MTPVRASATAVFCAEGLTRRGCVSQDGTSQTATTPRATTPKTTAPVSAAILTCLDIAICPVPPQPLPKAPILVYHAWQAVALPAPPASEPRNDCMHRSDED